MAEEADASVVAVVVIALLAWFVQPLATLLDRHTALTYSPPLYSSPWHPCTYSATPHACGEATPVAAEAELFHYVLYQ